MGVQDKFEYRMVKTVAYVEDSGKVETYGICCRSSGESGPGAADGGQVVPDISTESAFVQKLVDQLLKHQMDPVHLLDFIHDNLP